METLMILTYAGLCIAIFKIFKIPLTKWTVPTAILGGIFMLAAILLLMNYNHPYTKMGREFFVSVPIVTAHEKLAKLSIWRRALKISLLNQ